MSLKSSVVIVNEYTVKGKDGKGSRGGTPGDYTLRYMARGDATENLGAVRRSNTEDFINRYMARSEASEILNTKSEIQERFTKIDGLSGVAFGYGDVSLPDDKLRLASKDIQNNFDLGKTVLKTVLSFDEAYLKENGIIPSDFKYRRRGDYRGSVDQLKLRKAIMSGLDKMSTKYDDLQYVGVIQVDTGNVHCHLAMVDRGEGEITKDGTQRGKLSAHNMSLLRRGIDSYLDEYQMVAYLASNVSYDKRNAKCFIKKFAHEKMAENGDFQFLLASLPNDKRLWRADTNRKEMRKPNEIVRTLVENLLEQENSGYEEALQSVRMYASERKVREGLSESEYRRLIDTGDKDIISDCMNSVYDVAKGVANDERTVLTPVLDVMSMDYGELLEKKNKEGGSFLDFGFKLRSYSSRLNHHKKERSKYYTARKSYEDLSSEGGVSEDSKPLYDFFKIEEEYNEKCMAKYQHFLKFIPNEEEYAEDLRLLLEYKKRVGDMQSMREDKNIRRMKSENAEDYGKRVYDMHGGQYTVLNPSILESRHNMMKDTLGLKEENFKNKVIEYGLKYEDDKVINEVAHDFEEVKSLDLHHLSFDFAQNVEVSDTNVINFVKQTQERYNAYLLAQEYLDATNQHTYLPEAEVTDIINMKDTAVALMDNRKIMSALALDSNTFYERWKTIPLDTDYKKKLEVSIKNVVQTYEFELN